MAMRPPMDQTLWDAGQSNRGPYDSVFAPRPDMQGPVGPDGMGFGAPGGSNMPVIGTQPPQLLVEPNPQQRWDAQQTPGGQDGGLAYVQQLAKLFMGGGGRQGMGGGPMDDGASGGSMGGGGGAP